MRRTVLVSHDPGLALDVCTAWAPDDDVTLVLLDHAAAVLRRGHELAGAYADAARAGVALIVHDHALRRRGLPVDRVPDSCKVADLDEIADLVATADRAAWL